VLDLRRPQMQSNLRLRHNVVKLIRRYLEDEHEFVEVCWLYLLLHLSIVLSEFPPNIFYLSYTYFLFSLRNGIRCSGPIFLLNCNISSCDVVLDGK
jgi:hypothetical protein